MKVKACESGQTKDPREILLVHFGNNGPVQIIEQTRYGHCPSLSFAFEGKTTDEFPVLSQKRDFHVAAQPSDAVEEFPSQVGAGV